MLLETAGGAAFGAILRLVPEAFKIWDRKNERAHELAMQDKALAFEQLRGANRLEEIRAEGEEKYDQGALAALIESVKAQARTASKRIDELTQSVRPVTTYALLTLYIAVKLLLTVAALTAAAVGLLLQSDLSLVAFLQAFTVTLKEVAAVIWTPADAALLAGVFNFWFLGRVFDKAGR